ncbi:MAG: hypothetical protein EXS46_01875 [Candidatus Taylorbacteria bacterium]|nr:hypothetical protein [Candidatus Taylorbacteria bacterium]
MNETIKIGDFSVTVEARFPGVSQPLLVAEDGYISDVNVLPEKFFVVVTVNPMILCTGVIMNGGQNKTMSDSPFRMDGNHMVFRRDMQVFRTSNGAAHMRPGQNNVRFALLSRDGSVEYYEVSLSIQVDKLFLTIQRKGKGHFYQTKGTLECTGIRDELRDLLAGIFKKELESWRLPAGGKDETVPLPESRDPSNGVVPWYDDGRQTGMLEVYEGEEKPLRPVSVSWQACPPRGENGRRYLMAGEVVRILEERQRKDTRSSIKTEATKVEIITAVAPPVITSPRQATTGTS